MVHIQGDPEVYTPTEDKHSTLESVVPSLNTSTRLPKLGKNLPISETPNLITKSESRLEIEKKINDSHDGAHAEIWKWCKRHPLRGVTAIASMILYGDVGERTAKEWQQLPSWQRYQQAYRELEELEKRENFQGMHFYAAQLEMLAEKLPENLRHKAYYPFAGTDLYWLRIFENVTFEDIGYFRPYVKNMWWDPKNYSRESLERVITTLKNAGIIPADNKYNFVSQNSEKVEGLNKLNNENCSLILKGGHSVVDYLKKSVKKEQLSFGAILIASPADDRESLIKELDKFGYECVYSEKGVSFFYAPYAMGLKDLFVFLKKS